MFNENDVYEEGIKTRKYMEPKLPFSFALSIMAVLICIVTALCCVDSNMRAYKNSNDNNMAAIRYTAQQCAKYLKESGTELLDITYTGKSLKDMAVELSSVTYRYVDTELDNGIIYDYNDFMKYYNTILPANYLKDASPSVAEVCRYAAKITCRALVNRESSMADEILDSDFCELENENEIQRCLEDCMVINNTFNLVAWIACFFAIGFTLLSIYILYKFKVSLSDWGRDNLHYTKEVLDDFIEYESAYLCRDDEDEDEDEESKETKESEEEDS